MQPPSPPTPPSSPARPRLACNFFPTEKALNWAFKSLQRPLVEIWIQFSHRKCSKELLLPLCGQSRPSVHPHGRLWWLWTALNVFLSGLAFQKAMLEPSLNNWCNSMLFLFSGRPWNPIRALMQPLRLVVITAPEICRRPDSVIPLPLPLCNKPFPSSLSGHFQWLLFPLFPTLIHYNSCTQFLRVIPSQPIRALRVTTWYYVMPVVSSWLATPPTTPNDSHNSDQEISCFLRTVGHPSSRSRELGSLFSFLPSPKQEEPPANKFYQ